RNPRASPTTSSPLCTFPSPVSHALKVTRSASSESEYSSPRLRKPAATRGPASMSPDAIGESESKRAWPAKWMWLAAAASRNHAVDQKFFAVVQDRERHVVQDAVSDDEHVGGGDPVLERRHEPPVEPLRERHDIGRVGRLQRAAKAGDLVAEPVHIQLHGCHV